MTALHNKKHSELDSYTWFHRDREIATPEHAKQVTLQDICIIYNCKKCQWSSLQYDFMHQKLAGQRGHVASHSQPSDWPGGQPRS